jgi:hypothetical protein
LQIQEQALGPEHPNVVVSLSNLANLNYQQDKYYEAGPLLARVLAIYERVLGSQHPDS